MANVPRLHLISSNAICSVERFPDVARRAAAGGVDAVHIRERGMPARTQLELALLVQKQLANSDTAIQINDRIDVAQLVDGAGVHLPEQGIQVPAARRLLTENRLIGVSVHGVEAARQAEADGADYIIAGHIYATGSKPGQQGRGLGFLRTVADAVSIPVIAIGGITPERVAEVVSAGAHGVAVLSGILQADDPQAASRAFHDAMRRSEIG